MLLRLPCDKPSSSHPAVQVTRTQVARATGERCRFCCARVITQAKLVSKLRNYATGGHGLVWHA